MPGGDAIPQRPGRIEVRSGARPRTAFGHDDVDAHVELVVIRTADGHHWDGLHVRPRTVVPGRAQTLVVVVHGSMGNCMGGVPRRLAFELARHGFPVLSANTRMANFGVVYGGGLFDETPLDVDAMLDLARDMGFTRVVLAGYSLGAVIVTNHQALRHAPEVVGLCTFAHPWSLPESIRRRWTGYGARPSYTEMERMVLRAGADRDGPDDVVVVRRGAGPTDAPADAELWTLKTWWRCRGPRSRAAVSLDRIRDAGVPVALIQPGADPVLPGGDGDILAQAARAAGVPAHLEVVPDADHTFWGLVPHAAARAAAWIDGLPATGAPVPPPPEETGERARIVTIVADDDAHHDAVLALHERATAERRAATGRRTAIVMLHGNQGSMTVGALRFLRAPLAATGVPVLTLDTRIGNVAQLFGTAVLADAVHDVRAAAAWLAAEGFDHLIVAGYSLGATVAIHAAARELPLPLRGVAAFGAAWSLPQSSRERMERCGAAPSYEELVELCRPYADRAPRDDLELVVHRMYGAEDLPRYAGVYTARTWWHSRGPEAPAAEAHRHIGDIAAPVLLVQGTDDVIVDPADAGRLADRARDAGNGDVTVAMLEGQGHGFTDHAATAAAACAWLTRVA